jgi:Tol biopolymer transport system component
VRRNERPRGGLGESHGAAWFPDRAAATDGHVWVAPLAGGTAARVTHDESRYHFLHGISPDGETLAFVELPRDDGFSRPAVSR